MRDMRLQVINLANKLNQYEGAILVEQWWGRIGGRCGDGHGGGEADFPYGDTNPGFKRKE